MIPDNQITQIYEFIKEVNKFKEIYRLSLVSPNGRRESDAEHTWHLLMIFWILNDQLSITLDQLKCIKMLLVHDLVEIYAGDTFGLSLKDVTESKKEKEIVAASRLFTQLPPSIGQEFQLVWEEYEIRETPESKIVWAIDKLHPRIQYVLAHGMIAEELEINHERSQEQELKMGAIDPVFKDLLSLIKDDLRKMNLSN